MSNNESINYFGPVKYEITQKPDIHKREDVVFKAENKSELKMDIYYPQRLKNNKIPFLMIINGGTAPSLKPDYRKAASFSSWAELFADKGVAAVVPTWRYKNPEDISDCLEFIENNKAELGLDTGKLCIFAMCGGISKGLEFIQRMKFSLDESIKGMIIYYGKIQSGTARELLEMKIPNYFVAMGAKDDRVTADCNDSFLRKLKNAGSNLEFYVHSTGRHGFDVIDGGEETEKIIENTLTFVIKCLQYPIPLDIFCP